MKRAGFLAQGTLQSFRDLDNEPRYSGVLSNTGGGSEVLASKMQSYFEAMKQIGNYASPMPVLVPSYWIWNGYPLSTAGGGKRSGGQTCRAPEARRKQPILVYSVKKYLRAACVEKSQFRPFRL